MNERPSFALISSANPATVDPMLGDTGVPARSGRAGASAVFRRTLLRLAADAAGVTAAWALAPSWAQAAAPARRSGKYQLTVSYYAPFVGWPGNALSEFDRLFDAYRMAHPALQLNVQPNTGYNQIAADLVAGTAPDIFMYRDVSVLVQNGFLLDLASYLRTANINPPSLFVPGQVAALSATTGVYGLPAFTQVLVTAINEGIFDTMGLQYPAPDWTYQEWARLARSLTVSGGKQKRYGAAIFSPTNPDTVGQNFPAESYFRGFGASYVDRNLGTRCTLQDPAAVECASFFYDLLLQGAIADNCWPSCFNIFLNSPVPVVMSAEWQWPFSSLLAYRGLKWDYYPLPALPNELHEQRLPGHQRDHSGAGGGVGAVELDGDTAVLPEDAHGPHRIQPSAQ